ncbi:peptidase domain-containing ABC transporter [Paenibacillus albidus]|uniref:peptidase domain-containing ABC transporter n=1 Tax=Paenibacillus albidus TaxID=2041023 RepID=UPI001BEB2BDA|nr:peptidase domain-containing ABC transporter [Paenibacillus albidus]MBT2289866.1 peptidase domain-containing ABC transporter [Paenibacillus albidus]
MRTSRKKVPVILQKSKYDCGIVCLAMIIGYEEGIRVNIKKLKSERSLIGREGTDLMFLREIAHKYGYRLKGYKVSNLEEQTELTYPLMIHWNKNHFVILEQIKNGLASIIDPALGRMTLDIKTFNDSYSGVVVDLKKSDSYFAESDNRKEIAEKRMLSRIAKYLFQEKKMLCIIVLLSFIFQGINLVAPFMVQYVIDSFMNNSSERIPIRFISLMVVLSIFLIFFLSLARMSVIIKLQVQLNKNLTDQFVKKMFSVPMKFFEVNSSGDISTRINNIAVIREIISRLASTLVLDVSLLLVFCFVMIYYSPVLAGIVFIGAALQIAATKWLLPKIEVYTKQEVNSQTLFQSQLLEILRSMTFIKTIGDTDSIEKQLNELFYKQIDHFSKRMKISSVLGGVSNSVNLSLPLLILVIGVGLGSQLGLSVGSIVAFSTIAGRFMAPLGSIIGSLESVKFVEEIVERVESVLEEEDEELNTESKCEFDPQLESIRLENISFSYGGSSNVLTNINLTINPNEKISLIGKTGSGKSTLFKIISGLYKPTSGEIYYGDYRLDQMNLNKLREKVGFIVQDVSLFNDTVMNNIRYFNNHISREKAIQAAKDACVHEDIIKLPMGYDTFIGENGISLSGGQRQRIAIARVLAKDPQILLIDEGTSNLDKQTEHAILDRLHSMKITLISITHRTEQISDYESIYELQNGEITPIKVKIQNSLAKVVTG